MEQRTRNQEQKYNQALGYAWGRKDASKRRDDWTADVLAFATYFAMLEDLTRRHQTLQAAWHYFRALPLSEQEEYAKEWMRMAYVG